MGGVGKLMAAAGAWQFGWHDAHRSSCKPRPGRPLGSGEPDGRRRARSSGILLPVAWFSPR